MDKDYYSYIRKLFDKWAPLYNLTDLFLGGLRHKVADFTDARSEARILDVCTGTGKQAFAFAKKGYNVTGIDLSESMLNVAKKNNKYSVVRFEVADATNMPFEDNHFDVSSISLALHDMPFDIREKALKEITRVTKPNGTIVIVDYHLPEHKIHRCLIYGFVRLYESKYYTDFVRSDLSELLEKLNIKVEKELLISLGVFKIIRAINKKKLS